MQTNNRKRVLVLVLSLLFMFVCGGITLLFTPVQTARAIAITEEEAITSEYVDSLRYGYNVAGGRALCDDGLKISSPILKPMSEGLYKHVAKFEINSKTNAGNYIADSAVGIAKQSGTILSGGISAQVKVVNMDVSTSFNMQSNQQKTSQERFETFYQQIKHSSYIIQGNVDLRNYLTDDFKDDLLSVKSSKDAIALYNKYGTHLFTGFEYGGLLEITNYMKTDSNTVKLSNASSLSSKMAVAFNGYGGGTDFSFSSTFENEEKRTFGTSNYKVALYGGESITALSIDQLFTYNESMLDGNGHYVYDRWVKSINDGKKMAIIGTPSSARNVPLWELLPDGGEYGIAKQNMIQGYAELCGDKYKEFLEKYPTTPRTIGETTEEGDIVVSGYSVTYKDFTSYYSLANNTSGTYEIYPNSTVSMNFKDNDTSTPKKWRLLDTNDEVKLKANGDGKEFNTSNGSFTLDESATGPISIGFYNTLTNELLYSIKFTIVKPKYLGGDGSENNPYLIGSVEDFANINGNKDHGNHFKLVHDIDFAGVTNADNTNITIGSATNKFSGVFDGNNCAIKNLTIKDIASNEGNVALIAIFPYNDGIIKNLTIENLQINIDGVLGVVDNNDAITTKYTINYIGGIVGINTKTISNCKVVNSSILVNDKTTKVLDDTAIYCGGIAGKSSGTIEQCAVEKTSISSSIQASTSKGSHRCYVAGILGHASGGKIEYSYINDIDSISVQTKGYHARSYAGGVLGFIEQNTTVSLTNVIVGKISSIESNATKGSGTEAKEKHLVLASNGDTSVGVGGNIEISNSYVVSMTGFNLAPDNKITSGFTERESVTLNTIKVDSSIWCESVSGFPVLQKQTFNPQSALSIDYSYAKTEYYLGEEFNLSGVTVSGRYANIDDIISLESFKIGIVESNDSVVSTKVFDLLGEYNVRVEAMGFAKTFKIKVRPVEVKYLKVQCKEGTTLYVGDEANIDDFDISYVLENGTIVAQNEVSAHPNVNFPTDEIEIEDLTYSLGENQIFAVCGDIRSYGIVDAVEREFTSIEIDTANSELGLTYEDGVYKVNDPDAFKVGDKFDAKDVAVKAYYTNSSATTFALRNGEAYLDVDPSELEVIGETITKGENEIILSYGPYVTCTIALNVVEEEKYIVTFLDENGDVISAEEYSLGDTISTPTNPSKASDNVYDYAFAGWDKQVVSTCEGNATYTATYTKTKREYTITFKLDDGSEILTGTYNYGDKVLVPTATKQATKQSVFVFTSWDKVVSDTCVGDATYTAIFTEEKREYTVTFQNDDGTVLLTSTYHYDDVIVAPENPIKASDSIYYYEFNKWNPTFVEGTKVIGNATYVATYTATAKDPTVTDKVYYTIKFLDWDGAILSNKLYELGDTVVVPTSPTRKETLEATYDFNGWDRNVVSTCQGNATYTATYVETKKEYTVTFNDDEGNNIFTSTYYYGDKILVPVVNKPSTKEYVYEFVGWGKTVSETCVGDATYTAQYFKKKIEYTITFKNDDGVTLLTSNYYYNDTIIAPSDPIKISDALYVYTFKGWNPTFVEGTKVIGNVTYTATYSATPKDSTTPDKVYYTVKFVDWDGTVLSNRAYELGDTVVVPNDPTRKETLLATYEFSGWDRVIVGTCEGNATYTATYIENKKEYTVTFKNEDGSDILSSTYYYGDKVVVPVVSKPSTKEYVYTFAGWNKPVSDVCIGSVEYTAVFVPEKRTYTVLFKNEDGVTLLSSTYYYGEIIIAPGDPVKASDSSYSYSFKGWNPVLEENAVVVGNVTYVATYSAMPKDTVPEDIYYTVKFLDWDGTVLSNKLYKAGESVVKPMNPQRMDTLFATYEFAGWDRNVAETCEGNAIYTATYVETKIPYTVTFKNDDGNEILSNTYYYGDKILVPVVNKPSTKEYTYSFAGWDKAVSEICIGNAEYTAVFTENKIAYTVTFKNDDGVTLLTSNYYYGEVIVAPSSPIKASDSTYTYEFTGWSPLFEDGTTVVGNATYIATYTATAKDPTVTDKVYYMVKFLDWDGTVLSSKSYELGDTVVVPSSPTRKATLESTFAFDGWDRNVVANCQGNATYTATYVETKIPYTVTFKNDDGNEILSNTYYYGDKILVPVVNKPSTKEYSYVFAGWSRVVSEICLGNAEYTAVFVENKIEYTVTFKNDDGVTLLSNTYYYGEVIVAPGNPIKENDSVYSYNFNGWNPAFTQGATVVGNVTYVATYTATPKDSTTLDKVYYMVKFLDWDGAVLSNKLYEISDTVVVPTNPTRKETAEASYEFNGWDRNVVATCQGNATYTATYVETKKEYTVTFKNDDGSEILSSTYYYGDKILVPVVNKPSTKEYVYTFAGWNKAVSETCIGNAEYTAVFVENKIEYTVTFKNDDGVILLSNAYYYGEVIVAPSKPIKVEDSLYTYVFKGWNPTFEEGSTVVGNATYVATYTATAKDPMIEDKIYYTVKFLDWDGTVLSTKSYEEGEIIVKPENPQRKDTLFATYKFDGWDRNVVATCQGNATYTATYVETKKEHTVTFKNEDGSEILSSTYYYGDKIIIPVVNKPSTKEYVYTFAGWDKAVSETCVGNVEYTAMFTESKIAYIVTFKNDDGVILLSSTYYYGEVIVVPSSPVKVEDLLYTYVFKGWNPTFVEGATVVGNATYVATYTATPKDSTTPDKVYYTVKFVDWDGTVLSNRAYELGDTVVVPNNPTRKETLLATYEFSGWDRVIVGTCEGNATYTATYVENKKEYTVTFKNEDGSDILSSTYYYGDKILVPVVSKPSTKEYTYSFAGWNRAVSETCVGNAEYTARFISTAILYTVTFKDWDGSIIAKQENCLYNADVEFPKANPIRADDNLYAYEFVSWNNTATKVNGNMEFVAVYKFTLKSDIPTTKHTVTFKNWDDKVIISTEYKYGEKIYIPTATRSSTNTHKYVFANWDKSVSEICVGDAEYKANFIEEEIFYTVTFKNDDGSVILSSTYRYGETIVMPSNPQKANGEVNVTYTFKGWSNAGTTVIGDMEFVAVYDMKSSSTGGTDVKVDVTKKGCGAHAMDTIGMIAGFAVIALLFKKMFAKA